MLLAGESIVTSLLPELVHGLLVGPVLPTLLPVLLQPVLHALLQPAIHVARVMHVMEAVTVVALVQSLALKDQEQPLPEQEQHPLLGQVLELATDGQEREAPHQNIFTTKTALLLVVLLTLIVPLERAVHVQLVHALTVRPVPAAALLAVPLGAWLTHSLEIKTTS